MSAPATVHVDDPTSGTGGISKDHGDGRAVVTLTPTAARAARRIGSQLGNATITEVVRRGLILLDLLVSLPDSEELVIRRKDTGECERLRFAWDTF